jgi:hypothetical protein
VTGVIAAGFDHYDSRAGDPHLHTHVVVSNKAMPVNGDGWKSLWGTPVYDSAVALSEHHAAVLADLMTARFGVRWEIRDQGPKNNPSWEIAGVPEDLLQGFSSRSCDIDAETDKLVAEYAERHHRQPSRTTLIRLRQQATLSTRPEKRVHSLAVLTEQWRERADEMLQTDAQEFAQNVLSSPDSLPLLRTDDIPEELITETARQVLAVVGEKKSTWKPWNLRAEVSRQTMGWRFVTHCDREAITGLISEKAQELSVKLTPDALPVPEQLQRADGTSEFRPKHSEIFTSQELLDAEARLLELSRDTAGPTATLTALKASIRSSENVDLGSDQADALSRIAVSGLVLDVLVGPAGAGKTTVMNTLRRAWEVEHGTGSVVGLAPSAVAAQVLGEDLGISTENTAKWLTDHLRKGMSFKPGQLVIVDEASLAGTFTLEKIASHAAEVGAKVLLVGDWAQLQAVEAGGAFNLIVTSRDDTPELFDVHRFHNEWEKAASLELRFGNPSVLPVYAEHGRIHEGDADEMRESAYRAWQRDMAEGLQTVLVAEDRTTVTELNRQARHDRIIAGIVDPSRELHLADGTRASVGDIIITRRNDRRIQAGSTGWVRNGDRWKITAITADGSAIARRAGLDRGGSAVLPADYVKEHVDLGYAVTGFRSQGVTVDTSHVVVTEATSRESLYVAMTRGRAENTVYVATRDTPDDSSHLSDSEKTAIEVLTGIMKNSAAGQSAHQAKRAEEDRWQNIGQLLNECQTLIGIARKRWDTQPAEAKAAWLLDRSVRPSRREPIAGLVREPAIPMATDIRKALEVRRQAIETRITTLANQALAESPPWLKDLGPRPADLQGRYRWNQALRTVIAYRDAYSVTSDSALGKVGITPEQRSSRATAEEKILNIRRQGGPNQQLMPAEPVVRRAPYVLSL